MRKTILIPTDFTVNSLNVLKSILVNNQGMQTFDILLVHGISLSDSIRDLLFYSKAKQIESLTNPEFEEACEVIKNKFDSQISSLRIDLFTGYNLSAFENYLEGNKVEQIFTTDNKSVLSNKNSFDLSRFIDKCSVQVIKIDSGFNTIIPEKGKIAEVFMNQISMG
ncbi:hypothetical protein HKT18_02730 [Flavobacterium sp. IMCC34852]|uniref:Universal stress protein n=1 Tax=Flavobacterium rivulicola TaxID=2732161 RepID=A0A7Y3R870_9FLAO|nr:hypothetical protein [Flavobacterium sp. IMCC34852]NNT71122.1 hypothetical protein [Flavobacterium sp. IMCC34852]